jgi:hypothetical protein
LGEWTLEIKWMVIFHICFTLTLDNHVHALSHLRL